MAAVGVRTVTLGASVAWTLGRAVLLLIVFGPLVPSLAAWVRGSPGRWALLLAPLVFPELLIGYAYAPWVAGLPWRAEVACAVLLGLRALPVMVLGWQLAPRTSVTNSARYCAALITTGRVCERAGFAGDALLEPSLTLRVTAAEPLWSWRDSVQLWIAGPLRQWIPAAALFLLVTFQEFELAAILRAASWTDWLFVAQVQGQVLTTALSHAFLPASLQLVGMAAVAFLMGDDEGLEDGDPISARLTWSLILVLATAWLLVIVVPLGQLLPGLPRGLIQLATQRMRWLGLLKELAVGVSISTCAAATAWSIAGWMTSRGRWSLWLCLPGLLGSLILALALLGLFQRDVMSLLYDTPVPWLAGLVLFALPRAVLLQSWSRAQPQSARFIAGLLRQSSAARQRGLGRQLLWKSQGEPQFLAIALLTYWGYLELTLAYLLAPTGMTSGIVRLYNFMHFGRTSALSAEAAVLLLGPLAGTWCLWLLVRWRMRMSSGG